MKKKIIDTGEEEGLKRFALISPLLEEGISAAELAQRRCLLLQKEGISERTARRWIASYKQNGFSGLVRQARNDKGVSKSISPEVLALAEQMRRELPRRSAGLICELLEREGHKIARSTLERQLREKGLSGRQLAKEANAGGATRRFVRVGRNTLWHKQTTNERSELCRSLSIFTKATSSTGPICRTRTTQKRSSERIFLSSSMMLQDL